MILSDFLSRQRIDKSNLHEIIPISFDMKAILNNKHYNVEKDNRHLVQTCSQSKETGVRLLEVHGAEKGLDPDLKPEWNNEKDSEISSKT